MTHKVSRRGLSLAAVIALGGCGVQTTATSTSTAGTTSAARPAQAAGAGAAAVPGADWPSFGDGPQSSGVGAADTGITATDLDSLTLREVTVDGVVDSSAVELHDVRIAGRARDLVAVTTSYGKTIAFDAGSGQRLWQFIPRGVYSRPGNPQVTTATPVIDPDHRYLYSASPDGVIHKLSITTGRQIWQRTITFDPRHEKIASSLNVSGPWVVAVTGGYIGDIPPYDGHVVMINRSTGHINHVWNTECAGRHQLIPAPSCPVTNTRGDDAIWGRAGAIIEPGSGRILVATGNGPFDGRSSWGDSVLELSPDASRLLHNWTPPNQLALARGDVDLGSSSPALLGEYHGYRPAVQAGKDGELHLLNLNRLDGTAGGAGPRLGGELSQSSAPGGAEVLTQPAVWHSGGRTYVFIADGAGTAAYVLTGASHPRLATVWSDTAAGTSPVIAGGLLYVYDPGGALRIRRPLTGTVLRSLAASPGHWNSPIVVDGRIIEPTGAYGSSATQSTVDVWYLPGR